MTMPKNGSDANLKRAASKITPVVQSHINILQSMQSKMAG